MGRVIITATRIMAIRTVIHTMVTPTTAINTADALGMPRARRIM